MLLTSGIRPARTILQKENLKSLATIPMRILPIRENSPKVMDATPRLCPPLSFLPCLLAGICRASSWIMWRRTSSYKSRATPKTEPGPLMPDFYVTVHRSALIQPGVWKPLNQMFFSSLIYPKFNGTMVQDSTVSYQQKQK